MADRFTRCERDDWHSANAMELSKFCLARGRYEVASELHQLGTEWYERFAKPEGGATASDHRIYRDVLKSYKDFLPEFALLIETRDRVLLTLKNHPEGIDRDKLKAKVAHRGVTSFGVICNQLARGGWLRQQKAGKKQVLSPETTSPVSDDVFINREIPKPGEIETRARSAQPVATLDIGVPSGRRSGCLWGLLGSALVTLALVFAILHVV